MATEYINSFGTILRRGTPPVAIASVQDIDGPGSSTEVDDITNHSSPGGVREKRPSIKDAGDVSFDLVFNLNDPTHDHLTGLYQAWSDEAIDPYELEYPDGTGERFEGFVSNIARQAPVVGHLSAAVTITITSEPTPVIDFTP